MQTFQGENGDNCFGHNYIVSTVDSHKKKYIYIYISCQKKKKKKLYRVKQQATENQKKGDYVKIIGN